MSKSLGEKHYINLFGDADRIRKQIKSAVTDSGVHTEGVIAPGVENLFNLLKACGKMDIYNAQMDIYISGNIRYGDLKQEVGEAIVELTQPFRERLADLQSRKKEVQNQIKESSANIRKIAQETMREVKELTGALNVKL